MYFKNGWLSRVYVVLNRPVFKFRIYTFPVWFWVKGTFDSTKRAAILVFFFNTLIKLIIGVNLSEPVPTSLKL